MPLAPRKILQTGDLDIKILISKNLTRPSGSRCDGCCEAILRVLICGAQGQMSQGLVGGLWIISVSAGLLKSFSTNRDGLSMTRA